MMGRSQRREPKLFYTNLNLESRVPAEHPLRRVSELVDFQFVRERVRGLYGRRGQPSVDPVVLIKLMFLLYFENVRSERALMDQLPLRLDWLWFCGYDLDDTVPHHSVISKARRRWGVSVFESLFEQVLAQCVASGLVEGRVVHMDASLIAANASRDRLRPAMRLAAQTLYQSLEAPPDDDVERSDERQAPSTAWDDDDDGPRGASDGVPPELPTAPISPVDPDARLKTIGSKTVLGYKDHRVVDDRSGVITASITTDAATAESHMLTELLDQHERHVGRRVSTVVADKGYGTAANYQSLRRRGVTPCIPHVRVAPPQSRFPVSAFAYDVVQDLYICPAGRTLEPYTVEVAERRRRYRAARGVCEACALREQCTTNVTGRIVSRHLLQDDITWADECCSKMRRRLLMRRRKIRAEGSFADASNNHGYKRARWRRRWRVQIQNLLIATIQNLRKLMKTGPVKPLAARLVESATAISLQLSKWLRQRISVVQSPVPSSII